MKKAHAILSGACAMLLAASACAAGNVAPPTFTITVGPNLEKFVSQNPDNPTIEMDYSYMPSGSTYPATTGPNAVLSGIAPGQYDWASAIKYIEQPQFMFYAGVMTSLKFEVNGTLDPNVNMLCTGKPMDPTVQYQHVDISVTYNNASGNCQLDWSAT